MAVKNYGIHDKWTDLDKLNNVDIKSVDGVIESVKINGEESQSGGESDLTTATLTLENIAENPAFPEIFVPWVAEPFWDGQITSDSALNYEEFPTTIKVIMYKGKARLYMAGVVSANATLEGNITRTADDEFAYYITGDCKITLNVED